MNFDLNNFSLIESISFDHSSNHKWVPVKTRNQFQKFKMIALRASNSSWI